MNLRILADDLTGALDAAAPFASVESPVRLVYVAGLMGGLRQTLSTESRDMPEQKAAGAVLAGFARLGEEANSSTLWFKKVDSVLRGHPLTETVAMMRAGGFSRCVFAPAFPAMGRITRDGRQLVRGPGGEWTETPVGDLRKAFARLAPEADIVVADALTQDDLCIAVEALGRSSTTLWAGSRGLAEALSTPIVSLPIPDVGLFILGSNHPATRAQAKIIREVAEQAPSAGPLLPNASRPIVVDPVPKTRSGSETLMALASALPRVQAPADCSAIFVAGGDCLTEVLNGAQVEALDCLGEVGPGLPLSRVIGGSLAGTKLVTKSGGFGGLDLLRRFIASLRKT